MIKTLAILSSVILFTAGVGLGQTPTPTPPPIVVTPVTTPTPTPTPSATPTPTPEATFRVSLTPAQAASVGPDFAAFIASEVSAGKLTLPSNFAVAGLKRLNLVMLRNGGQVWFGAYTPSH